MRFWDSSALVPLCLIEPASQVVRHLLEEDPAVVAWWGSPVECWSAFARLRREGVLGSRDEQAARKILATLSDAWTEIQPGDELRVLAGRLLRVHPLRAADALQLAAALAAAGSPTSGEIVVLDERLAEAARIEGLTPIP